MHAWHHVYVRACGHVCTRVIRGCMCTRPCGIAVRAPVRSVVPLSVPLFAVWYRCLCPCSQCGIAVCAPVRSVVSLSVPQFAVWYRYPCPCSQCGIAARAPVRSVVPLSVPLFAVWYRYPCPSSQCGIAVGVPVRSACSQPTEWRIYIRPKYPYCTATCVARTSWST